jgi:hypothetical protein
MSRLGIAVSLPCMGQPHQYPRRAPYTFESSCGSENSPVGKFYEPPGDRTQDTRLKRPVLYQLS